VRRQRGRLDGVSDVGDSVFSSGLELVQAGRGKSRDLPIARTLAQRANREHRTLCQLVRLLLRDVLQHAV
jgi:hypothetical protein